MMQMKRTVRVALASVLAFSFSTLGAADFIGRSEVDGFIDTMVSRHGFEREQLVLVIGEAERKQKILDAISRPVEKTKSWRGYRRIFVTDTRIDQGVEFWRGHHATLLRAQEQFGVPAQIIVATLGVETRYGRQRGGYRVIDALSTLAFDYSPRSSFFRGELEQFLLLAREEHKAPGELMGSYAGAMGYGQFMPSSYRAYAVDFDGDGVRDIWDNPADAIGSIANYYQRHGWRIQDGVAWRASSLKRDATALANGRLKPERPLSDYVTRGGVLPTGVERDTMVTLMHLEGERGDEYWLGLHNFYVITRYNHSRLYAMAVFQLGEEILGEIADVLTQGDE